MIQGFTATNISAELSTEDNRINTTVAKTQIRFLVKFINDLDGSIAYVYPNSVIYDRYTGMSFIYEAVLTSVDLYSAEIHLLPSGHWKYEVYEVSWVGSVVVAFGTAPANESDVLPVADTNGVVQGIVTKGILNLTEKKGTEQVQYTQHEAPDTPNFVWYGEDIVLWNPADESSIVAFYKNKTGITLESGKVSIWKDSSSNTNDMSKDVPINQPGYTASTGGVIFDASTFTFLEAQEPITLATEFTIGFKLKATTFLGAIIKDHPTGGASRISLGGITGISIQPTSGLGASLATTTGNWEDAYVVITRDAANLISLNVNGILQTVTSTAANSFIFQSMGDLLDASIFEIQIYNSTSPTLTSNINERLSNI
jgi:hypothetical protein